MQTDRERGVVAPHRGVDTAGVQFGDSLVENCLSSVPFYFSSSNHSYADFVQRLRR